jgi:hypothetical protein
MAQGSPLGQCRDLAGHLQGAGGSAARTRTAFRCTIVQEDVHWISGHLVRQSGALAQTSSKSCTTASGTCAKAQRPVIDSARAQCLASSICSASGSAAAREPSRGPQFLQARIITRAVRTAQGVGRASAAAAMQACTLFITAVVRGPPELLHKAEARRRAVRPVRERL